MVKAWQEAAARKQQRGRQEELRERGAARAKLNQELGQAAQAMKKGDVRTGERFLRDALRTALAAKDDEVRTSQRGADGWTQDARGEKERLL